MDNSDNIMMRHSADKPLNLSDKVSKYKFPVIAFLLSLYAWFPKIQTSLNPQFFIPVDLTHSPVEPREIPFVHAFTSDKRPQLLIHRNKTYSLFELSSNMTKCTSNKAAILPTPEIKVSVSAGQLGLSQDPPLQIYSYHLCLDHTYITKRRSHCDPKFLIVDSYLTFVSVEYNLEKRYSLDLGKRLGTELLEKCKMSDFTVNIDVINHFAVVFLTFTKKLSEEVKVVEESESNTAGNGQEKPDSQIPGSCPYDYTLIKFNVETGEIVEQKTILKSEKFQEWSKYSASLHGFMHSWRDYTDTRMTPRFLISNHDLLMKQEATRVTQGSRPSIRDMLQGGEQLSQQLHSLYIDGEADISQLRSQLSRHNSFFIHFSEGVLVVRNDTLEPITFLAVTSNAINHTISLIWDQDVRTIASVDIGSTLQTIGIPRIFAESRILGQTEPLYQKLLSVQDLVGMTIEESLEEMKFLQPPIVFTPGKASKFDHMNLLTSGRLTSDPKFMFHIGYGTIKCYDLEGVLLWKSETKAKWQSKLKFIRADRTLHSLFKPAIKPIASMNAFVFQGFDHVAIISQLNGQELGAHNLPSIPILDPVVFDFNLDGIDDVIITNRNGMIGFTLCSTMTNVQFWVFYVAATFALFLLFLATNIHWFNTD